jgi:hypothetical protein
MGRQLASCSDPQRIVSARQKLARSARASQARKRAVTAVEKRGRVVAKEPHLPTPHRTEADLDLAQRMLAALQKGSDLRLRKVRRLKAAIKVRAYENDLKFQVAFERLRASVKSG